jgi:cytidine deaminase
VLSFPAVAYVPGRSARNSPRNVRREYDPELNACFLGDILVSWEHAAAQAETYGHGVKRELCYLLAHGIFHLCGYDHQTIPEQKEMRAMEEKALKLAGVTREGQPAATPTDAQLVALAREAMARSYSPYSRFKVGACLLSADGRIYTGCNVENASFGLTNCAERTALFKAVSEGATSFAAIAIAAEHAAPWPCGACRQALNEFAPDLRVLVSWEKDNVEESTLSALLPHSFGPKELP